MSFKLTLNPDQSIAGYVHFILIVLYVNFVTLKTRLLNININ